MARRVRPRSSANNSDGQPGLLSTQHAALQIAAQHFVPTRANRSLALHVGSPSSRSTRDMRRNPRYRCLLHDENVPTTNVDRGTWEVPATNSSFFCRTSSAISPSSNIDSARQAEWSAVSGSSERGSRAGDSCSIFQEIFWSRRQVDRQMLSRISCFDLKRLSGRRSGSDCGGRSHDLFSRTENQAPCAGYKQDAVGARRSTLQAGGIE